MDKGKFPKWIFKTINGFTYAYRNIRCVAGFDVAVRVGVDGVIVFGKNGLSPNLFFMNCEEFATLEDFKGSKGEGFRPFEVGCVRLNGSHWFSDCIYEPGLIETDYEELKSLLLTFHHDHIQNLPTKKQLERINRFIDLRGKNFVEKYFYSKYPNGDFENMTKESAQKVITGLQWIEPRSPLKNVYTHTEWIS
jgi:hypothetical protein